MIFFTFLVPLVPQSTTKKNIQEVYEAYGLRHMGVSVAFFFVIWCVTIRVIE